MQLSEWHAQRRGGASPADDAAGVVPNEKPSAGAPAVCGGSGAEEAGAAAVAAGANREPPPVAPAAARPPQTCAAGDVKPVDPELWLLPCWHSSPDAVILVRAYRSLVYRHCPARAFRGSEGQSGSAATGVRSCNSHRTSEAETSGGRRRGSSGGGGSGLRGRRGC